MIKVNKYFIPYIIICLIVGFRGELFVSIAAVLFHEFIHYLTARKLGFSGFDIELSLVGARLKFEDLDEASPKEDFIISISGPLSNILTAVFFYFMYIKYGFSLLYILYVSNLFLGIFNLIPAFPLDGGRILRDIFALRNIYKKANMFTIYISVIIGILFMFLYIYLNFIGENNFSIGIIGLFIIVSSLKEGERVSYIIMGDIIKKKFNFIKKGFIQNKSASVFYKNDLLSVFSIIEKNRYNIFIVLDEDMKFMDVIYEEEIINALKKYGNIKIEEYLELRFL